MGRRNHVLACLLVTKLTRSIIIISSSSRIVVVAVAAVVVFYIATVQSQLID